jgi:hypothetical protein
MDQYGVFELAAPICATEDARHDRCAKVTRRLDRVLQHVASKRTL